MRFLFQGLLFCMLSPYLFRSALRNSTYSFAFSCSNTLYWVWSGILFEFWIWIGVIYFISLVGGSLFNIFNVDERWVILTVVHWGFHLLPWESIIWGSVWYLYVDLLNIFHMEVDRHRDPEGYYNGIGWWVCCHPFLGIINCFINCMVDVSMVEDRWGLL